MVKLYTWSAEDHAMRQSQELGNFVRLKDYAELEDDLSDSRLIAREQENAHIAANLRNTQLQERITKLEAFLNRCYEGSRAPYAEEMDNEHVPMPTEASDAADPSAPAPAEPAGGE